jgi:hypothetical protein
MGMETKIIPAEEIDKVKWNSAVHYAENGRIYGYQWYLYNILREWEAVVVGDYETILPLSKGQTNGRTEASIPFLPMQVYSIYRLNERRVNQCLEIWQKEKNKHDKLRIPANLQGAIHSIADQWEESVTYKLNLLPDYLELEKSFHPEFVSYLEDTHDQMGLFKSGIKPEVYIDFCEKNERKDYDPHGLQRILYNGMHRGIVQITAMYDKQNKPMAMGCFLYSHHRLEWLDVYTQKDQDGQQMTIRLIDTILKTHSGNNMLMEFNQLPEKIASGFGAIGDNWLLI